jgi:hypothetical protein
MMISNENTLPVTQRMAYLFEAAGTPLVIAKPEVLVESEYIEWLEDDGSNICPFPCIRALPNPLPLLPLLLPLPGLFELGPRPRPAWPMPWDDASPREAPDIDKALNAGCTAPPPFPPANSSIWAAAAASPAADPLLCDRVVGRISMLSLKSDTDMPAPPVRSTGNDGPPAGVSERADTASSSPEGRDMNSTSLPLECAVSSTCSKHKYTYFVR